MTLSQSQLRLLSSIGVGILVGTSLIVIIPEGIEAISTAGETAHAHGNKARHVAQSRTASVLWERTNTVRDSDCIFEIGSRDTQEVDNVKAALRSATMTVDPMDKREDKHESGSKPPPPATGAPHEEDRSARHMPTFEIGFSLMLGFVLMFLIDRLPRHATESLHSAPATRHISLDDLASSSVNGDEEQEGFLGSLTPTPRQSRGLATTTGLVIHAAADGIAMGASATTSNMKLGLIIFVAIMIHKAPAAFGLTSVLLKQGLSKRAARGHLIVFSLAAPFGALSTYLLISLLGGSMEGESGEWWTGMLLLFSAGTFL